MRLILIALLFICSSCSAKPQKDILPDFDNTTKIKILFLMDNYVRQNIDKNVKVYSYDYYTKELPKLAQRTLANKSYLYYAVEYKEPFLTIILYKANDLDVQYRFKLQKQTGCGWKIVTVREL